MKLFDILRRLFWGGHNKVYIGKEVNIVDSTIEDFTNFAERSSILNSTIGKRTSLGRYTIVRNSDIGRYCAISWRVSIGADQHPTERISGSAAFFQSRFGLVENNSSKGVVKRTIIGNDVLIGCHSILIAGVKVGDGAIIGSGSVVTKDVAPYQIVAGNPAKPIKMRFDEETISQLLKLDWWNLDDAFIKQNIGLFQQPLTKSIIIDLINKKYKL